MTNEEFFNQALKAVAEVSGVPELAIIQSNIRRHADARYVLVCALSRTMTDAEIGTFLHRTSQGIGFIRRTDRHSPLVKCNLKAVCKQLESLYSLS